MLRVGIVGLPNVGKSTLFNALTATRKAESANYPFCTIEPNVGVVNVPDERAYILKDLVKTQKVIPTAIEFVDIAGLVKGASKGEGLGNQFLGHIREVDAIIHVVRCFEDENTVHVSGKIDPLDDIEIIHAELALADMASIEKRRDRLKKQGKSGDKTYLIEDQALAKIYDILGESKIFSYDDFTEDEVPFVRQAQLISTKPVIYAANIAEDEMSIGTNKYVKIVKEYAEKRKSNVVVISAQIEAELSELSPEESKDYLNDLGVESSGVERMIKSAYDLLGLKTYFTAGEIEVRAWTIVAGTKAPQAAGVIHSDMERGFIRAEVTAYDDFVAAGSHAAAKEKGVTRLEGKEYIMNDGDIVYFRFAV